MIFEKGKILEEWRTNVVIPIFKKGERRLPDNYRAINLLNTHLKLTTKIIPNKLDKIIKIHDEQQGFRRNRSCIDAIFAIRKLSEKAYEFNKPVFRWQDVRINRPQVYQYEKEEDFIVFIK